MQQKNILNKSRLIRLEILIKHAAFVQINADTDTHHATTIY